MRRTMHERWCAAAGAAMLGLGLSGCASFWDDITARDRPLSTRCKEIFSKPDPLVVLRDSQDGDRRAQAIQRLKEPKQNKGTDQEQDVVFELLAKTAAADPQPLCRLVAIEKLGTFKDPRAAKALEAAFYGVDTLPGQYAKATTPRIQCAALVAMGNTGNPECVPLLAQVLREPTAERSDEAQNRNDRCAAAAKALGHFNDAQATEALLRVMQNKKEDLALRDCAYTSLREATGKHLPNDPVAWEGFLHPQNGNAVAQGDGALANLTGWFTKDSDLRPPEPLPKRMPKEAPAQEARRGVIPPAPSSGIVPVSANIPAPGAMPATPAGPPSAP